MGAKKKSLVNNFIYNLIYQIIAIIIPIIITPYVSRVLHVYGIGQYSFSYSVTNYFIIFANFGFGAYAQREISKHQDNKEKQTQIFLEIYLLKLFTTILSTLIYIFVLNLSTFNDYKIYLLCLIPSILAIGLDTTFLFQGNEDFKSIALRNIFIKLALLTSFFIFVKDENDLWIYTLINGLSPLISAIIILPLIKKQLVKPKDKINIFRHFLPCFKLFIPTVAVTLYTLIDRTMLGFLIPGETQILVDGKIITKKIADIQNGNYEQAEKIIKLVLTITTSLGAVMLPRNSYYHQIGDKKNFFKNINNSVKFVYFLGIPSMLGLIAIANIFCPWFYGEGYEELPDLLILFSPLLLFLGLNKIFGDQFLLACSRDNEYTLSVFTGAIVNVSLNVFLIPKLYARGAVIASVLSELSVLIVQLWLVRNEYKLSNLFKPIIKSFDAGLIMFLIIFTIANFLTPTILNTLIITAIGTIIYFGLLYLFKDEILKMTISKLKDKLHLKKKT